MPRQPTTSTWLGPVSIDAQGAAARPPTLNWDEAVVWGADTSLWPGPPRLRRVLSRRHSGQHSTRLLQLEPRHAAQREVPRQRQVDQRVHPSQPTRGHTRQTISWRNPSNLSAVARLEHCPRQSSRHSRAFPANLTSGGTASAPLSRIRDGRAPGGQHHSVWTALCVDGALAPGRTTATPLGSCVPELPCSPGSIFWRRSGRGLRGRTLRHHALGGKPPQSNQQIPPTRSPSPCACALPCRRRARETN